ncbi:helix-turn-helix transcriptional regulator [Rhizobium rhizogenes]|uniref:helix-turn-helix domain-containing protein n=1 Tax=Rhizobium rhizogenes TaxID=359 RepID=UPI001571E32F|nr:AraC family transcriptional regulator [Rhizobium rhizogenes]NTI24145.1 helix-turn-helix transcriptional regulator [Rhizobium rhizogenes]QTG03975.1 helix-turn-helix transcriptional regulator [Rhizobium rhizogenes]
MIGSAALDPNSVKRAEHLTFAHQHAVWGSVRADLIRRTGVGRQETKVVASDHTIMLNIGGIAREGEDYLDGRKVAFTPRQVGSVSFIPADHSWTGWDNGDPTASYLFLSVDKSFITGRFENVPGTNLNRLAPALGFRDSAVELAARRIRSEISRQDPMGIMSVESQIATIFVELLRRVGNKRQLIKGGLAPTVLKRLIEMIEASLERPVSIADLAREADLSDHHMSRAFRLSTGLPPHTYIIRRRLERAGELLRFSNASITEVAYMCGYSNPSHFSTAFRREMGIAPRQYRLAWGK